MALHEPLLHGIEPVGPGHALDGVDRWPSAITPSTVQLFTGTPSSRTTQAPQFDVSHPQCVPVRPKLVTQQVDEQDARLDVGRACLAIDGDSDVHQVSSPRARATGGMECPLGQLAGEVALVLRRAALIGARVAMLGGERRGRGDRLVGGGLAAQRSSAAGEQNCSAPTAVSPIPTSLTVSPSSHTQAPAAATAQSPARRSTLRYADPPPGRIGTRISVIISAGPTAVSYGPA